MTDLQIVYISGMGYDLRAPRTRSLSLYITSGRVNKHRALREMSHYHRCDLDPFQHIFEFLLHAFPYV